MRTYVPVTQTAGNTAGKPTRAARRPGGVDAVLAIGAFLKASAHWLLEQMEASRRRHTEAKLHFYFPDERGAARPASRKARSTNEE
jgi:hypothetical protein